MALGLVGLVAFKTGYPLLPFMQRNALTKRISLDDVEVDHNKMMFMKIVRVLKNARIKSIGNMVQVLSAVEVDPVFGMAEEAFVPWNPKVLRRSRHERRKELLRVWFRAWSWFVAGAQY